MKVDVASGTTVKLTNDKVDDVVEADGAYYYSSNSELVRVAKDAPYKTTRVPGSFGSRILIGPDKKAIFGVATSALVKATVGPNPVLANVLDVPLELRYRTEFDVVGPNLVTLSTTEDEAGVHYAVSVLDGTSGALRRQFDTSKRTTWLQRVSGIADVRLNASATALYGVEACDATSERFVRLDASGTVTGRACHEVPAGHGTDPKISPIAARDAVLVDESFGLSWPHSLVRM